MGQEEQLYQLFPEKLKRLLVQAEIPFESLQELRLRAEEPVIAVVESEEWYLQEGGGRTRQVKNAFRAGRRDLQEILERAGKYSLYAYEEELRQGYLTLQGGHRMGISGKAVLEQGTVRSIKYVSFLNLRIAHQKKGCADQLLPFLYNRDGHICQTLLIAPPGGGKTTVLRDLIRQVSDGNTYGRGVTVGVVDERSELGACYMGTPQNDLGMRTDVLDCCPKAQGMLLLLRAMAPQVIAVDEIGSRKDLEAIEYVNHCGCSIIATVHGASVEDIKVRPVLREMLQERLFERYVVLGSRKRPGEVLQIFDDRGTLLTGVRSLK
ncbi:stage III sporulation protein AA [Cuneatibacter caecimuris]|uniref:Stage III sporulation protein AA n=1 Tax=Cuneatibacter caecimuris TaxID=1796618 RepID=A0A4Q7PK33_9FIRM|nr:stage III sporulation protein AA [Cuneatibacter caecimuris]RZT00855.1 stage III sporulation protein AA [Cuneatibacter caecimuris]